MKILIADDHALFREGLQLNLEQFFNPVQILSAETYAQALQVLKDTPQIHLVLVDLDMPDKNWQEGLESLMKQAPQSLFVVISATEDVKVIRAVMEKGAKGYISKRSEPKIVTAAIKLVLDGGTYLPPLILESLTPNKAMPENKNGKLTARQSEVLQYISQGLSNKQIAYELGVSEATVKLHINAMLKALKATNRTQALVNAQKEGLI